MSGASGEAPCGSFDGGCEWATARFLLLRRKNTIDSIP